MKAIIPMNKNKEKQAVKFWNLYLCIIWNILSGKDYQANESKINDIIGNPYMNDRKIILTE